MAAHVCESCGMLHDAPTSVESAEVAIARIQAEAQVKIAQLQARQDKDWNETRVETAKIEAEASVDVAESEAEVIVAALTSEDTPVDEAAVDGPAPVAVVQDVDTTPEVPAPPAHEDAPEHHETRKTSRGLGLW